MKETKMLYRIIGQKDGITVTAETNVEVTREEAKEIGKKEVLSPDMPFVTLPLTTKERWDNGAINFCPRCGNSIQDFGLDESASFDCFECDASLHVNVTVYQGVEEDE